MAIAPTGFEEILKEIDDLASYLARNNISLSPQSRLAQAIDNARKAVESWQNDIVPPSLDAHLCTSDLANIWRLSSLVMRAKRTQLETELIKKLPLLARADPLPLTPGKQSTERDKMFEVIVACVCSLFASGVHFLEPDIVCTYKQARWGIACKAAYGSSRTTAQKIRDGIGQIERSGAELGIVVVQMTNRFPHNNMYKVDNATSEIKSLSNEKAQKCLFQQHLKQLSDEIESEMTNNLKQHPHELDNKVRGVLFVANTVAYFKARRAVMGGGVFIRFSRLVTTPEDDFVETFNRWWQS